ncbi:Putative zinc ribbon domain-containing protein [Evansella caseinilytica]|uniref:Putative zinc ribbon domain-containing protein n=1 Tax=Evansella caseinilytica TaxID=1503961 RepID=A0A1H3HAE8_9BACI|nr:zinc ribbon domain-containing protein [Evansella caseinilytica]SDY11868.1 Putative zinc ribbon domain-containing protein [Evansella caseinilytica]
MEKEMRFCQSCSMPLENPEQFGTNADGSKNEEYCHYCFKDGKFVANVTMVEMIEQCIPHVSGGNPWPDEATARNAMLELFPKLKRWREQTKENRS